MHRAQQLRAREKKGKRKQKKYPKKRRMGKPIIAAQGVPLCEVCGGKVKLGSDPLTGTSLVWCANCGESALTRYLQDGQRFHDQGETLKAEIEALKITTKLDKKLSERAKGRVQKPFSVVGRDMADRIAAA